MPDDHTDELSLPPLSGASASEVLHAALPLIVRLASDSASASTRSATTQAAVEVKLDQFKASIDHNTAAISRWADELEKENQIRHEEIKARAEGSKRWHDTFRAVITPQVVLQVIVQVLTLIALLAGVNQMMPHAPAPQSATLPEVEDPSPPEIQPYP